MLVLAVSYASSMRAWLNQRSETNSLRAEIVQRHQAIKRLQADELRWRDPAFVQEQARVRFGWIMPGQVGYRVVGAGGKVLQTGPTLPVTSARAHPTPDWWQSAWGSVVAAGDVPKQVRHADHPAKKIDRSGRPSR
jgi:hypothetical protein